MLSWRFGGSGAPLTNYPGLSDVITVSCVNCLILLQEEGEPVDSHLLLHCLPGGDQGEGDAGRAVLLVHEALQTVSEETNQSQSQATAQRLHRWSFGKKCGLG